MGTPFFNPPNAYVPPKPFTPARPAFLPSRSADLGEPLRLPRAVVVNVLDVVHPDVLKIGADIRKRFPSSLVLTYKYGMCNGVGQMVNDVLDELGKEMLKVLRLWSHGMPGAQGVTLGRDPFPNQRAAIKADSVIPMWPTLEKLGPKFVRGGRAELRGCQVGIGSDGRTLLRELANCWKVNVYAGYREQPIALGDWVGPVMKASPGQEPMTVSGPPLE